jgi:hypothetical protein
MDTAIIITGEGIPLFRLMALRGCIILEGKGIRMTKKSVTAGVRKNLGLPARTPRADVLVALDKMIEGQKAKLKPGDIR